MDGSKSGLALCGCTVLSLAYLGWRVLCWPTLDGEFYVGLLGWRVLTLDGEFCVGLPWMESSVLAYLGWRVLCWPTWMESSNLDVLPWMESSMLPTLDGEF